MAGGLFPGYPFAPNWKCIVFTAAIASGYWYLPPKNLWVLAFLLWLPYVAMAWYDYHYKCQEMQPTLFPFGRAVFLPFKPPTYQAKFDALPPEAIQAMDAVDHAVMYTLMVVVSLVLFAVVT